MRPGDGRQAYRWTKAEIMEDFTTNSYCIDDLRGIPEEYIEKYMDDRHLSMDVCDICNSDSQAGFHFNCAMKAGTFDEDDGIVSLPTTTYFQHSWEVANGIKFRYSLDKGAPCRICSELADDGSDLCGKHRRQQTRLLRKYRRLIDLANREACLVELEMIKRQIEDESTVQDAP